MSMSDTTAHQAVPSADGSTIVYDRYGSGERTAVMVGGVFSFRHESTVVGVARALADRYGMTVVTYDRRGRGDSTDNARDFRVEHEIADLAALVGAVGSPVSLVGWSSGAVLAMRGLASGELEGVERLVAFEPPFVVEGSFHTPPPEFPERLRELVAQDQRSEVVRYFMTQGMGIPGFFVTIMRLTPFWSKLKATAHTAPYDWSVMGDYMRGEPLRVADWGRVTVPTLALAGARSEATLRAATKAIAELLPVAEHREIARLSHNANPKVLAPVLGEYLTGRA